ncbi:MAG: hypothetical protein AAGG51_16820 [Cyanobacteria bacterium P01_G01_bin.54]
MITIPPPDTLKFLKSICWQLSDFYDLTLEQMLSRYENGWRYREMFDNLETEEREFIKTLAQAFGSWLIVEL